MAAYLATATIGQFDLAPTRSTGSSTGTRSTPTCSSAPSRAPARSYALTGIGRAGLQAADAHDRRARRRRDSSRSASTATPSRTGDFFFVEAHTAGADDWTTLRDEQRPHAAGETTFACSGALKLHPFLAHYLRRRRSARARRGHDRRVVGGERAAPTGYERWIVDLARLRGPHRRGRADLRHRRGPPVRRRRRRRHRGLRAAGSTSFEDDGDTLDGWTVPGAPAGSPPNATTGPAARSRRHRRRRGDVARAALARAAGGPRLPRRLFGPYPFSRAGSIIDDDDDRLRAREPDAPDLLARVLRGPGETATPWSSTSSPTSGWATAGRRTLARRLAQRGLRDLRGVAVGASARGARTAQARRQQPRRLGWRRLSAIPWPAGPAYRRSPRAVSTSALAMHALRRSSATASSPSRDDRRQRNAGRSTGAHALAQVAGSAADAPCLSRH